MCRASVLALVSLAATGVEAITYEGYAADTVCTNGYLNTVDGVDNSAFAPNHTVTCMLLDYCITSGYTLLEKQGDVYVGKYQLDPAGVTMMVTALEGLRDANVRNNVMFRIDGTVSTDPAGTGAHSGEPTAANFRAAATYMDKPLGVVFETTSVTALEPGPALPYPLQPTEAPHDGAAEGAAEDDSTAMAGSSIGVVAAVVVVALGAMVYFEQKGRPQGKTKTHPHDPVTDRNAIPVTMTPPGSAAPPSLLPPAQQQPESALLPLLPPRHFGEQHASRHQVGPGQ